VGGHAKVEMAKLKATFETLGFRSVRTYINSGNVLFESNAKDRLGLTRKIERGVERDAGFPIQTLVRTADEIEGLVDSIPRSWVNDRTMRCDVLFLWPDVDSPAVLAEIPIRRELEDLVYRPGALVWRVDRAKVGQSRVGRIIGSDLYRKLTIRNVNTVRKLNALLRAD
jgi:uncharacterized protein (DUF1697 family)